MIKKINYYLILFIIFALPSYLVRFSFFNIPTTLLEILIYLSALLSLFYLSAEKSNLIKNYNKLFIPIILFVLGGIIGTLISPDKLSALGQFKAYIFNPILFFFVLALNISTKKDLKNILYTLFFSTIIVSGYSIYQYLTGAPTDSGRVIGIFGYSPNYVALYLTPLFIVGLYLTIIDIKNNTFFSILKMIILVTIVWAIILSGSRGAVLAILGAIGLTYIIKNIYYLKNKTYRSVIVVILVLIIAISGYFLIKPDYSISGEDAGRIGSSNNIRWEIYKTTMLNILPANYHWLNGVGLGNYQNYFTQISANWVNYPEYIAPKALTAHNLFLQTYMNTGLIGLIGFIWILTLFFKNISFKNKYSYIILVAMIAILIQGLVDTPYWKNDLSLIFWILIFVSLFQQKQLIINK